MYMAEQRWEILRQIDLQKMPILPKENHLFRWSSFYLGGNVNKQNCCIWGTENPHAPKTNHCLVQILVHRPNWAIFLLKWARRGRYSQWHHYRAMLNEFLFTKIEEDLVSTGQRCVPHTRSYTRCFAPCFWRKNHLFRWSSFWSWRVL